MERCRRPCPVANRATLPQKWPPPPRNVADSCELTATTTGDLKEKYYKGITYSELPTNASTTHTWNQ